MSGVQVQAGAYARTGVQVQANNGADTPANSSTKLQESLLTQLRGLYRLGELLGVDLRSTVGDAAAGLVVLGGWVLIGWVGVVVGKAGGGAYR